MLSQLLALLWHRASIGKVVAEAKYAANVTGYIPLIRSKNVDAIRALLTNTTQEQVVLDGASFKLAIAWEAAKARSAISEGFVARVQAAVVRVYRELIDIMTEVEVQYLLQRLS